MKTLFLFLAVSTLALANENKSSRLEKIYKNCLQNSLAEGKDQEKVCSCLRANYERKFDEKALDVLSKAHQGNLEKDALESNEAILEFDLLASEKCVEDPLWKWEPEKSDAQKGKEKAASKKSAAKEKKQSLPPLKTAPKSE